jgi:hypothetical protein
MKKNDMDDSELYLGLKRKTNQEHLEISSTGYGLVSVTEEETIKNKGHKKS